MEKRVLKGLEPAAVFQYFEEICGIPHGSGNIQQISDYLVEFAKKNGLEYVQESCGNVIMHAPATPGYEGKPGVILQGHMDMVAVKDADCTKDMEKEGLDLFIEEDPAGVATKGLVGARGTTLGGDDGIAVAMAMAVLADKTILHPAIDFVATVNEETGMDGAIALDPANIRERQLINIDSEDEGIFIAGCAGGATLRLRFPVEREDLPGADVYTITLRGLQGGHSGTEIHKNRANAILLMGRVLKSLPGARLLFLDGGTKDNAIPVSAKAVVAVTGADLDLSAITAELQNAFAGKEDGLTITLEKFGGSMSRVGVLSEACQEKLLNLLTILPFGPAAMSTLPELVETSDNVGIIRTTEDMVEIATSVRSLIESEKQALIEKISTMGELCGATVSRNSEYPGWQYRMDSPLRDLAVAAYREQYGEEPQVLTIHAGLECGLLLEKIPDLDAISMGPQMHDIHTTKERMDIASVERTWRLLKAILGKM
ncbi:MAG: aminoacyl-histidine dipeptidase [Lachnospiraceae bacterium]|nr:aminoacyl-histidine dipeptidase [Lachnospiraceae bacterium]